MSYYDTIDDDVKRAKEILAEGSAAQELEGVTAPVVISLSGGTILGKDLYAAYKLLESFVAEIERLQADQKMLATVIRSTVVALGDVPDDWEGSVADGVALINANVYHIHAELEWLRSLVDAVGEDVCKTALRMKARDHDQSPDK